MRFVLNKPFETVNAVVEVDAGMAIGSYRFQLVVQGESGLKSDPAEMTVVVTRTGLPPPVFDGRAPISLVAVPPARPDSIRAAPETPSVSRQPAKAKPAKAKPAKNKPAKRKPAKPAPAKPAPAKSKPAKRRRKPRTPPP